MDAIFTRTSVRKFTEQLPTMEQLDKVLRAGMAAPSAHNQQPWEFFVVTDKAKLEALSQSTPYTMCAKNAPVAIVLVSRDPSQLSTPEYKDIDMAICAENVWLELEAQGLGGVMLGIAPHEDRMDYVAEVLGLPPSLRPFIIIACGYPLKRKPQQDRYDAARVHWVE